MKTDVHTVDCPRDVAKRVFLLSRTAMHGEVWSVRVRLRGSSSGKKAYVIPIDSVGKQGSI